MPSLFPFYVFHLQDDDRKDRRDREKEKERSKEKEKDKEKDRKDRDKEKEKDKDKESVLGKLLLTVLGKLMKLNPKSVSCLCFTHLG